MARDAVGLREALAGGRSVESSDPGLLENLEASSRVVEGRLRATKWRPRMDSAEAVRRTARDQWSRLPRKRGT